MTAEMRGPGAEHLRPDPRDVLIRRKGILTKALDPFVEASLELVRQFHGTADPSEASELPLGATRDIYRSLLQDPRCIDVRQLWIGDEPWSDDHRLLKVFGFGFNAFKTFENGSVIVKQRDSALGERRIPYALHTHFDVLFFMQQYGLGTSDLSKSLAALHDTPEVGERLVRNGKEIVGTEAIEPTTFRDSFREDNLGYQLSIGVPALIESRYEDLPQGMGKAYAAKPIVQERLAAMNNKFPGAQLQKHVIQDPLVFGGLALQVQETVTRLLEKSSQGSTGVLTSQQLQELAVRIMEVEIGDRMSEIADLERFIVSGEEYSPQYARLRVLLRTARIKNMLEKLQTVIDQHGLTEHFAKATTGCEALVEAKLADVNAEMAERKEEYNGVSSITKDEIDQFYQQYRPLQIAADEVVRPFITQKVTGILSPT